MPSVYQTRAFVFCVALAAAACGTTPYRTPADGNSAGSPVTTPTTATIPAALRRCELSMGWDPWEPYQYLNVEGELKGLDVELVTTIAGRAGCELRFEQGSWATMLPMLQQGTLDLLPGATRTATRERYAFFSDPYRSETWRLYVRAGESGKWNADTLEELLRQGFRVGITEQYVYGDAITGLQEDARYAGQFVGSEVGELNFARLLESEIDGFLEDPFVAAAVLRRKGLQQRIAAYPLELHSGDVSLMMSRASVEPALVERINRALAELRADGTYDRIVGKYREP